MKTEQEIRERLKIIQELEQDDRSKDSTDTEIRLSVSKRTLLWVLNELEE